MKTRGETSQRYVYGKKRRFEKKPSTETKCTSTIKRLVLVCWSQAVFCSASITRRSK